MNEEKIIKKLSANYFKSGINGRDEFFNAAVLVLLIEQNNELYFVFQKRGKDISQDGEICFPGGKYDFEKDKDYEETALRECEEELGIVRDKIKMCGKLDTIIAPMGAIIEVYVGIAKISLDEIKHNEEVESVIIIPVSWFIENPPAKHKVLIKIHPSYYDSRTEEEIVLMPTKEYNLSNKYQSPWGNFKYGVYFYKSNYGIIWGITSRIVVDFIKNIRGD